MTHSILKRSEHRCFGGVQGFYEAHSQACAGPMRFSVFLPPQALAGQRVPAVYYLAGLTCTEEQLPIKVAAQRTAAELGLALVSCDTSPRTLRYPGDDHGGYGLGAGFYVDALQAPWAESYRMATHVVTELPGWVEAEFPISTERRGIFGHSMGGHGALTLGLKYATRYASVSAFAPIVAPSLVPWGQTAFSQYFGPDVQQWRDYEACHLVKQIPRSSLLLVHQGLVDPFLQRELRPELFEAACAQAGQALDLRKMPGYDHSYYFIQSFVDDHLRHHARALLA